MPSPTPGAVGRKRSRGTEHPAPGSAAALRVANQRRVLAMLVRHGDDPVSQAEIVRETGLAAGTVSGIVRGLAARDVVRTVAGSGRRATTVRLARAAGLVAAVDFGHAHLRVAVGDMAGRVLAEHREPLTHEHACADGLGLAHSLMLGLLDDLGSTTTNVRNVGMGLPAPLNDGVVMSSAILPGWVGLNAQDEAAKVFSANVLVENDANLGALGEQHLGAGRGHDNLAFVKVSSGVGAGLILDGQLYRGAGGVSGEIGHLTLNEQGPLCRCGSRGCLEAYAASNAVLTMMSGQLPEATIEDVVIAAEGGNMAAVRVFEDAGLHLGRGLAAIANLLNPDLIVVGGDMARAGEMLLEPARMGLRRHTLAGQSGTPVAVAELGDRASVVGALMLAIDATDLTTA